MPAGMGSRFITSSLNPRNFAPVARSSILRSHASRSADESLFHLQGRVANKTAPSNLRASSRFGASFLLLKND